MPSSHQPSFLPLKSSEKKRRKGRRREEGAKPCRIQTLISDMSNKQIFQVYHGPGNVRYGPTGIDLTDFIVSERGIDRPAERSVPSIKGWLMRGLRVALQISDITINVIVRRQGTQM
uniref:Transposase MuDR N-terminal domain-containing protein n=2 Tax=Oryza sativa subsp. japonica TaxID=39947 RepID=Q10BY2_ORYSJ|nr:hypothetical protein [Oryza sativa Japonica Group]ABF99509.1 hypothetical protein LOC_Os03g59780 [Oryza sativa Japonica Group]